MQWTLFGKGDVTILQTQGCVCNIYQIDNKLKDWTGSSIQRRSSDWEDSGYFRVDIDFMNFVSNFNLSSVNVTAVH